MSGKTESAYAERVRAVCGHIYEHLDGDLSLERLARVAGFSPFHFHRQFTAHTGVSVARFIQLMRLRRASYRLAFRPADRIIDIALDAGFETPESFARAFRNAFGQSPSRFRKQPAWRAWMATYQFPRPEREHDMDVRIIDFQTTLVAALEHRGAPDRLLDTVRAFIAWRRESGLSPVATSRTFGIAYDDPDTTPPERFRFDVCGAVEADVPANPQGVVTKVIPGGRCAVARHHGSTDRIGETVWRMFREWLPGSGEAPGDFPCFFHYLNLLPDAAEHELVTDVHLPLK